MNAHAPIETPASVYAKIAAVQGELAHAGIRKDSENTFDRYKFRGIDAVYNALAPLLAKHGLCVLPRIIERDCQERVSRKGEPMFYVTVTAEFDFVSADDGSVHTVRTYGEAMDRSDKATNKAMSAAYKYAAFMAFAIPTEGDNDADASTPEVSAAKPASQTISNEQLVRLQSLIQATSSNVQAFCQRLKVDRLDALPPAKFSKALELLETKLAEMAKAETAQKAKASAHFGELADDQIPY